jgi:hypothetical protein
MLRKLLATLAVLACPCHAAEWTAIQWQSAKIGDRVVQRAALMVPVQADGKDQQILAQLDLGTPVTVFKAAPCQQIFGKEAVPADKVSRLPFTGTLAGVRVRDYWIDVIPRGAFSPPGQPILLGGIGADFFQNRILLLDFVRQRLCILNEHVKLSPELENSASFVPLTMRNGKLIVPVTVNGRTEADFFYDTGASLFPLATTRARRQAFTGRTGQESDNEIWRVNSAGREAVMVGARIAGELRVGAARLQDPLVFFESSGLANLQNISLFGNALFFDRFTVIVDIPGKRFGLVGRM